MVRLRDVTLAAWAGARVCAARARLLPALLLLLCLTVAWVTGPESQAAPPLDPTRPGLPTLRGGWVPPDVPAPRPLDWRQAGQEARRLHDTIGLLGDGDLPDALAGLLTLSAEDCAAAHRQEALHYVGRALSLGGLPLLGCTYQVDALAGANTAIRRAALRELEAAERRWPGLAALLELDVEQVDGRQAPTLRARVALLQGVGLLRRGEVGAGVALLRSVAPSSHLAARAKEIAAVHLAKGDEAAALALLSPGEEPGGGCGADAKRAASCWLAAARLLYGSRDLEPAASLFERAATALPGDAAPRLGHAWTLARLGRPADALRLLHSLSDASREPPPAAHVLAARLYAEACEIERAEALLQRAVELLRSDLERLGRSRETGHLVRVLDAPKDEVATLLMSLPQDLPLLRLMAALPGEAARLQKQSHTPGGLVTAAQLPELESRHTDQKRRLYRRAEEALGRRAEYAERALRQELWRALGLRNELLERRKERLREALAGQRTLEAAAPAADGVAWSFAATGWSDPALQSGTLRFGACPLSGRGP